MKSIAVLITCHNRVAKSISCLENLFACEVSGEYEFKVFLVDDGSTDGTGAAVRSAFPQVEVIDGDGQLFWNRGMHLAWSMASRRPFDAYVWLNDDTNLFSDALVTMLKAAEATRFQSVICGTTVSPDGSGRITYGGFDSGGARIVPNGELTPCSWFNGNCVLIPSGVFSVVGMNDPAYRHSLGDFDYGVRARKAGFQLVVAHAVIGLCADHDVEPRWRRKGIPLIERLRALYGPLGCNPFGHFRFDLRKSGVALACFHFITIHLRCFFPGLWSPS